MNYTKLGESGLTISRLVLGCMSYGEPGRGGHGWSLDEDASRPFFRAAVEAGITTFDTADVYAGTRAEVVLGNALKGQRREGLEIFTKVFWPTGPGGANDMGLSRKHIMESIHGSLRRLQTDYVDLYQAHRYDPHTPIEETMLALHDVVRAGKVRYIGASSMWAWQFARMQHVAELGGWTPFVSMQDQYNPIMREEEREMHPFCSATGVGVLSYSPLARGRLSRPYGAASERLGLDETGAKLYRQDETSDRAISDAVGSIADERGISRAQVVLAWQFTKPAVSAPIIGATKPNHLSDAVAALDVELTADEVARIEAPYTPRRPEGFV